PNPIDRSEARRRETNAALFELTREGIVNALVHRDYGIAGGKCQLVVTPNTVAIKSPGGPVEPITLEQLQSFNAPMLSRNPVLHYVFARMGMAEERGLGLKSMRSGAENAGLPLPKYTWENPYLVLTLLRSREAAVSALPPSVLAALTDSERAGWQWLAVRGRAKSSEYAEAIQVEDRTGRRHLTRFLELGLVRKTGSGPSTEYEVV
ncbi:MAG: hypothetical protein NTV92_02650, partial [Candidatus Bipolaricaulota bacterium]|nr:hypothetical protein [Candidatus Bipolaricaulota bacterium]